MYDIVIKNATIINPYKKENYINDLAVKDNIIVKIDKNINDGKIVIDAEGLYLTPGLIDCHTHCYYTTGIPKAWAGDYSIIPDAFSFRNGVTTMIDAGSSGLLNFSHFKSTVIERANTKLYAMINICDYGMSTLMVEQFPDKFEIDKCIKLCMEYPDIIVGVKVAHYWFDDWAHIDLGLKVAKETNLPLMVDFGVFKKSRPTHELLNKLRKGDILTHCYRAPVPVIDDNGKVYNYLFEAKEKGVLFDLGHGQGSFLFRNAHPAIQQNFKPDFVSTDIHVLSMNEGCQDMLCVMSKCLAMGMTFEEIIEASTIKPANAFSIKDVDKLYNISEGSYANIALFSIMNGKFGYKDIGGGVLKGDKRIYCELTIKDGEIVWDYNAMAGIDYRKLPRLYSMNFELEDYTPPIQ